MYINLIWSHSHFHSSFATISHHLTVQVLLSAFHVWHGSPSPFTIVNSHLASPTSTFKTRSDERERLFHFHNIQVYGVIPMKTKYLVERCRWLCCCRMVVARAGIKKFTCSCGGRRCEKRRPLRIYRTVVNPNLKPHQVTNIIESYLFSLWIVSFQCSSSRARMNHEKSQLSRQQQKNL